MPGKFRARWVIPLNILTLATRRTFCLQARSIFLDFPSAASRGAASYFPPAYLLLLANFVTFLALLFKDT